MPPRMIPFPLVLLAIAGSFVLVALYADVRGREQRALREQQPVVEAVNEPVVAAPTPEPAATSTPEEQAEPQRLRLMSDAPGESDIPAVAVFDCWRFEIRDGRGIVDRTYRHLSGAGPEVVGPDTLHLRCGRISTAWQSTDGMTSVILLDASSTARENLGDGTRPTLWKADPYTGELTALPLPDGTDLNIYIIGTDADESTLFLSSTTAPGQLVAIPLNGDAARISNYTQLQRGEIVLNGDGSRAIGFERTPDGTVFLHRINTSNGQRVRVRAMPMGAGNGIPLDDRRLLFSAEDTALYVLDIFDGSAAPVRIGAFVDIYGLSIDGQTLLLTGPDLPLTTIPVSELPNP